MAKTMPAQDISLRPPVDWTKFQSFQRRVVLGRRGFGSFYFSIAHMRASKKNGGGDFFVVSCFTYADHSVIATSYFQQRFRDYDQAVMQFNNNALTLCDPLRTGLPPMDQLPWGDRVEERA